MLFFSKVKITNSAGYSKKNKIEIDIYRDTGVRRGDKSLEFRSVFFFFSGCRRQERKDMQQEEEEEKPLARRGLARPCRQLLRAAYVQEHSTHSSVRF